MINKCDCDLSNLSLEASSKSTSDIAKEIDLESENLSDSVAGTVQTCDEVQTENKVV